MTQLRSASLCALAVILLLALSWSPAGSFVHQPFVRDALASSCWDTGCIGLYPIGLCDDSSSYVVDGRNGNNDHPYAIQLWYSQNCGANWGKSWVQVFNAIGCTNDGVELDGTGNQFPEVVQTCDIYNGTTDYTDMLSGASHQDRVCRFDQTDYCTPWY